MRVPFLNAVNATVAVTAIFTSTNISSSTLAFHNGPSTSYLNIIVNQDTKNIQENTLATNKNTLSAEYSIRDSKIRNINKIKFNDSNNHSTVSATTANFSKSTMYSLSMTPNTIYELPISSLSSLYNQNYTSRMDFTTQTGQAQEHFILEEEDKVILGLEINKCREDTYTDDQIAYRVYANMPIGVFGILANILNILVFFDQEMRTVLVNHFLFALSVSDLILLICNIFFLVVPVIAVDTNSFFWNDIFPIFIRYSYPLALTAQTSGVYLTVLVSVHRFLGVCYPFRAKRWVTKKPVQYAICVAVLFSILVNIPTWLELSVIACYSKKFKSITREIILAPFHDMTYILVKKTVIYTFVMFFVPFVTLIIVNWRIILALRESSNLRTMHTYSTKASEYQSDVFKPTADIFKTKFTNSTRDRSVTLMLLAIVAIFLFCNGLAFCNSIVESIVLMYASNSDTSPLSNENNTSDDLITNEAEFQKPPPINNNEMEKMATIFERSVEISNVLITLNSATSVLVYLIFSSKYRMVLKSILGLRKRKKVNRVAITTAMAAQRAVELSLIPEEADNRKRQSEEQKRRMNNCNQRLFRSKTVLTTSSSNVSSLRHSESNLRLMEDEELNFDRTH